MKPLLRAGAPVLLLLGTVSCSLPGEETEDVRVEAEELRAAPVDVRQDHSLAWSGDELLVWGGHDADQHVPFADGAAYSPRTDSWRPLPESGLEPRTRHSTVMVDGRMLVWGGFTPTASGPPDGHLARDGAVYDPDEDTWEPITPAPEGRALARGAVVGGHVVFGGGNTGQDAEGFLVYSVEEDTWSTVALQDGNEDLTVYDLAVTDGTVVAVGGTPSALHTAVFGVDDETALVRKLAGTTESGEVNLFAGLAVTTEEDLLLALRGDESANLYEVDEYWRVDSKDTLPYTAFRPPVPAITYPLEAGEMDFVAGLGLLATGPGEFSMWAPGTGQAHRFQGGALSEYCGPLVPVSDDVLLGWGGRGCTTTGVKVDVVRGERA
ncbi:Kelch repeat-containing protein [Nocardiopsis xinjiangensis]|uniref:Kelch repeat-containing protein n=1 Tax=Nocardiopsis xinjiangensis TaxID=124285 RepID=UPI000346CEE6|nr:kelch repeat-containing protein [Nocardiopsis xinjiangensis]